MPEETTQAAQKQQGLSGMPSRTGFGRDPTRRQTLVRQYNEEMNATRPREYDGSHITFGGMNPAITLRGTPAGGDCPCAVRREYPAGPRSGRGQDLRDGGPLPWESKRLGLCQKSLFVVPNHLTEAVGLSEFPAALSPLQRFWSQPRRILNPTTGKSFGSRIATGDYDAVIIGHSQV